MPQIYIVVRRITVSRIREEALAPLFGIRVSDFEFPVYPASGSIGTVVTGTGEFFKTLSVTLPKR